MNSTVDRKQRTDLANLISQFAFYATIIGALVATGFFSFPPKPLKTLHFTHSHSVTQQTPILDGHINQGHIATQFATVKTKSLNFKLIGKGRIDNPSANQNGNWSRLEWTGPESQWMYQLGVRNFELRDLTIVRGGVHVPAVKGLGTGHGEFHNVCFYYRGVKFGSDEYNGNAADCSFYRCSFYQCPVAFQTTTSQNINFHFYDCFFNRCDVVALIAGGANVTMTNCYVIDCKQIFKITAGPTTLGWQNSQLAINGLTYDQNAKQTPCVLNDESKGGSGRRLVCNRLKVNVSWAKPSPLALFETGKAHWNISMTDGQGITSNKIIFCSDAYSLLIASRNRVSKDQPLMKEGPNQIVEWFSFTTKGGVNVDTEPDMK